MIKVVYLCARDHRLGVPSNVKVWYNDICVYAKPLDFECDCLDVDLTPFDILIATPPCNYWSKANYRRNRSAVALATKHLLPTLLQKFEATGKPFIIENVDNINLMEREFQATKHYWFRHCHHVYFTNRMSCLFDKGPLTFLKYKMSQGHRDGNPSVDYVLNTWLRSVLEQEFL